MNAVKDKVFTHERAFDDFDPPHQELLASETRYELLFDWNIKAHMVKEISYQLLAVDDALRQYEDYIPAPDTDSASTWSLCGKWIRQCIEDHKPCKPAISTSGYKPTRLLELKSRGAKLIVRLVVSKHEPPNGPYMTLSHCWGDSHIVKLTHDKEDSFRHNIDFHNLPKLYQEAMITTVRLGIRYLWIDSLCIIQDESHLPGSDWMQESRVMESVYKNSYCNIAASTAANSLGGLFSQRDVLDIKPVEVVLQGHPQGQLPFCLFPTELIQGHLDEPLNKRAWVLQEQLLAPRALVFTATQVRWECRSLEACESFPGRNPEPIIGRDLLCTATPARPVSKLKEWISSENPVYYNPDQRGMANFGSLWDVFCTSWKNIVEEYTSRLMTVPSDKLSALAGIATALSRNNSSKYVAGMWYQNFSMGYELCWMIGNPADGQPACRPKSYRAPTWSWASMDGAIFYHTKHDHTVTGDHNPSYIHRVEVQTVDGSPFGQIKSGFIEIEGPLRQVGSATRSYGPEDDIDTASGDLYVLTIIRQDADSEVWGIALRKIESGPDQGCYRRVGPFNHRDTYSDAGDDDDDSPTPFQLFCDAPKQLIRIV